MLFVWGLVCGRETPVRCFREKTGKSGSREEPESDGPKGPREPIIVLVLVLVLVLEDQDRPLKETK